MKSGNNAVSIGLVLLVFAAADAGRVSENGTGAMWIAPELVADAAQAQAQPCSQPAARHTELVFETLLDEDIDDLPRLLSTNAREVVDFEWNATTGELSFSTTAASNVFSDLEIPASQSSGLRAQSCGSR